MTDATGTTPCRNVHDSWVVSQTLPTPETVTWGGGAYGAGPDTARPCDPTA